MRGKGKFTGSRIHIMNTKANVIEMGIDTNSTVRNQNKTRGKAKNSLRRHKVTRMCMPGWAFVLMTPACPSSPPDRGG